MIRTSAIETLAPGRLSADLTKSVVTRLRSRLTLSPVQTKATPRGGKAPTGADLILTLDGQHFIVQTKGVAISAAELLTAVEASMSEWFSDYAQLLLVHKSDAELAPIISAVVEQVPGAVRARRQSLTEQHIDALVDVYMANDPLAAAMPDLERDNAEAQAHFLQRWPVLSAEDVAARAGHASKNRSATATRWKRAGKIFGMRSGGREVYPAFEFKNGEPRRSIAPVLAALPAGMSGWQIAFWFIGANSWLNDAAPVTRLDDEAALVAAARHEADAWMG
ncbi:hypothetical protein [Caulobacter rhizosphaerae]|uniref:hypothetical protein n=1 Tax=Caulobacter rhizosphaerae TaxID=2010972 RepID=UPI0013D44765|nr:hypothetical protein [Caulobacter rhizosphaerae]GGL35621.1 hypothetical protein GCM10010983_35780 [Caulobacter rhizosphaerae]